MAVVMCRDVGAMATDYMEGSLGWRQRLAIRMHLAICDGCRAFIQQMRRTVRLVGSLPVPSPPPETEARVLATLAEGPPPAG
jgi:anti-sigma factor ChrR (cupin superfamily)